MSKDIKLNSTKSMNEPKQLTDQEIMDKVKKMNVEIKKMPKVKISFPVALQKFLGTEVYLGHNLSGLVIPVDGKEYEVPKVFGDRARDLINNLTT